MDRISGAKFEISDGYPLQPIVRLRFLLIDGREHLVALLIQIDGGSQWHLVRLGLNRRHDFLATALVLIVYSSSSGR